jgi:hypothetical protein
MTRNKPRYLTYLIRLWAAEEMCASNQTNKTVWRVLLENVNTHSRYGFANLDQAFEYLHQQTLSAKEDSNEEE